MIQLGTKIVLNGFDDVDPARLVVAKKMIGSLSKKIEETKGTYERVEVTRSENTLNLKVVFKEDNVQEASAEHENLFFALSNAFQQLTQ